jgi:hypothetical protein
MKSTIVAAALRVAVFTCCAVVVSAAPGAGSEQPFHAARSAPEKALDEILRRSDHDDNLFEFVLKRPWFDPKKDKGYALLFTKQLLAAWAAAQAEQVRRDCQGKYVDGEVCGIDYNPIACGNATSEKGYVFRTKQANDREATISSRWAGQASRADGPLYRLVKEGGNWRLDGVDCGNSAKFNMN